MDPCWSCRTVPELAELLGHNETGHRIINALLLPYEEPGPIRTVERLCELTDDQLLSLRGIGPGRVAYIRQRLRGAGWPGSLRFLSLADRTQIVSAAVDAIESGRTAQHQQNTPDTDAAYADATCRVQHALQSILRLQPEDIRSNQAWLRR